MRPALRRCSGGTPIAARPAAARAARSPDAQYSGSHQRSSKGGQEIRAHGMAANSQATGAGFCSRACSGICPAHAAAHCRQHRDGILLHHSVAEHHRHPCDRRQAPRSEAAGDPEQREAQLCRDHRPRSEVLRQPALCVRSRIAAARSKADRGSGRAAIQACREARKARQEQQRYE